MAVRILLLVAGMLATPAWSAQTINEREVRQTVVIEDRGGLSITQFMDEPMDAAREPAPTIAESFERAKLAAAEGYFDPGLYPIRTPSMSVGPIGAMEVDQLNPAAIQFSFFIVGFDQVSINWLKANVDALSESVAMGLVVNVETPEQLKSLYDITENRLILTPTSGESLSEAINLYHYPAYFNRYEGVLR